jgi:NTE family protein
MPYLIQYFVNGLGRDEVACADLMSYLLFTPKYTRALLDIGYNDADRRIDEIEEYLYPSSSTNNRSLDVPRQKLATQPDKRSLRVED